MRPHKIHFFEMLNTRNSICGQPEYMVKLTNRTGNPDEVTCSNCLKSLSKVKKLTTHKILSDLIFIKSRLANNKDWRGVTIIQNTIAYMARLEGKLGIEDLESVQDNFMPEGISKTLDRALWLRVCKVFVDHLSLKQNQVKQTARIIDDLGADSLDTVELVMGMEEAFDIQIDDVEAERILTLRDAYDRVTEKLTMKRENCYHN